MDLRLCELRGGLVQLRSGLVRACAWRVGGLGRRLCIVLVSGRLREALIAECKGGTEARLTQEIHVCWCYVLCTRDPLHVANGRSWRYQQLRVEENVLTLVAGRSVSTYFS